MVHAGQKLWTSPRPRRSRGGTPVGNRSKGGQHAYPPKDLLGRTQRELIEKRESGRGPEGPNPPESSVTVPGRRPPTAPVAPTRILPQHHPEPRDID